MIDWKDKGWKEKARDIRRCLDELNSRLDGDVAGQAVVFQAREMLLHLCQSHAGVDVLQKKLPFTYLVEALGESVQRGQLTKPVIDYITAQGAVQHACRRVYGNGKKINAIKELRQQAKDMTEAMCLDLADENLMVFPARIPVLGLREAKAIVEYWIKTHNW